MNYSELDVLDFVEGRLDDQQTAEFLAQLRVDPDLAAAVETMQASQLPIAQAYKLHDTPPVPEALRRQVDALTASYEFEEKRQGSSTGSVVTDRTSINPVTNDGIQHSAKSRIGKLTAMGLTACLISGIAIGTLATKSYLQQNLKHNNIVSIELDAELSFNELKHNRLVKRIASYQSLYVENTVANLSATPIDDAAELLKSIDNSGHLPSSIPDFSALGYQFARAQELGFEGQALVQLVYKKTGSAPLALCFMRDAAMQSLPMVVSQHHGLNAASWVTDGHHYVLVAEEPNAVMKQLYDAASDIL